MSLCPPYDVTSGALAKYRWLAREGLAALTKEERHAYGKAGTPSWLSSDQNFSFVREARKSKAAVCQRHPFFRWR